MKFQMTTEYAIRVMVFLANERDKRFSTYKLHKILKIPYKYLGRLMNDLAKAGFLEVTRGKSGGYCLCKKRSRIFLYEIVDAIEGLDNFNRCVLGFDQCSDENPCTLHKYWTDQQKSLKDMIYNLSLEDLDRGLNVKW